MTNEQTTAWIFLATALASHKEPADLAAITTTADGINHAVPTENEINTSITWLTNLGLITHLDEKYSLTSKGLKAYANASKNTSILLKIWENLENGLKKLDIH